MYGGIAGDISNGIKWVFGIQQNDWDYLYDNNSDFRAGYNIGIKIGTAGGITYGIYNIAQGFRMIVTFKGAVIANSAGEVVQVVSGSLDGVIKAAKGLGITLVASRGIGGKGWRDDKTWKNNVKQVTEGGTIETINDSIPTQQEAIDLINESGGKVIRIEGPHPEGGVSPHTYPHINYETSSGVKGTIRILEVIEP